MKQIERIGLFIMAMLVVPLFLIGSTDGSQEFLRLHVLANSNNPADQLLKLKARDAILNELSTLLSNEKDINKVIEIIEANLGVIKAVAVEAIAAEYEVTIELTREIYPEKDYGRLIFPAGEYLSLKVNIGRGDGDNWWCVLFPMLCSLEAGENAIEVIDSVGGPPIKFRFKLAENKKAPPSLDAVLGFLQQFRLWP